MIEDGAVSWHPDVTPAQQLMVIVPKGAGLEIEATLANKDIGFNHAGQPVEIKVEAFAFTRYGMLHGTVTSLSQDVVAPQDASDPRGKRQDEDADASDEERRQARQPTYVAHVSVDATGDRDREWIRRAGTRHGGDGGDQDGTAHGDQLSAFAAVPVQARGAAGTMNATRSTRSILKAVGLAVIASGGLWAAGPLLTRSQTLAATGPRDVMDTADSVTVADAAGSVSPDGTVPPSDELVGSNDAVSLGDVDRAGFVGPGCEAWISPSVPRHVVAGDGNCRAGASQ